jgi:hypothetical protein
MTATVVKWVLDELGAVVDDIASTHTLANGDPVQLRRVDRDNTLLYDGGGAYDMSQAITERTASFQKGNYVGATFADVNDDYVGTQPDLDAERVVGIRIEGYSGAYGHVDPRGEDGIVFHGTDNSLVQRIKAQLYAGLKFPDAGRTDVAFTHLSLENETPAPADWQDHFRYDLDIRFSGWEEL